jgi:hypothetical protein
MVPPRSMRLKGAGGVQVWDSVEERSGGCLSWWKSQPQPRALKAARVGLPAIGGKPVLLCHVTYEPGTTVSRHSHPTAEQVMWIIKGDVTMTVGRFSRASSNSKTLSYRAAWQGRTPHRLIAGAIRGTRQHGPAPAVPVPTSIR